MAKILIIYATTDGQTRKISQRLQQVIEQQGGQVTLVAIQDLEQVDLPGFDAIVIGASIRYGKHNPLVVDFVEQHRLLLESRVNAFFSVNVVARKPDKRLPAQNPYLQKFLKRIAWQPQELAVFAGKIDYPSYRWFDRLMIRMIMWLTKGPTDPTAVIEFTDWSQVEAFGRQINDRSQTGTTR